MGSLKEKLLASAKLRTILVDIDGDEYLVREVSAADFADYGTQVKTDKARATALLVSKCVIDDEGNPLLTTEEAMSVVQSARLSVPIVNAILEVSGFGEKESDAS